MGEKLTELIKTEAMANKENNRTELSELIEVRFKGFEKEMMKKLDQRNEELKYFMSENL